MFFLFSPFLYIISIFVQGIAMHTGLNVVERPFDIMYPTSLFTKPIICVQDYINSIYSYTMKGVHD
jgi:hypothetical protein